MKSNKLFWKIVNKPFFLNKGDSGSNILVESNETWDDQKIADELNTYFKNAVSNLNKNYNMYIINHDSDNLSDPVDTAICKFQFHPSILLLKVSWKIRHLFRFNPHQNLAWRKKFKISILKRQLIRTLSHL